MKEKLKVLITGIVIGSMLTGATAFAASGTTNIKVVIQKLGIFVDGSKKATADAIIYKDTTYLPARTVSNAIGKEIGLVNGGIYIGKQPAIKITEDKAVDLVFDKFDKTENVKFKVIFMMDGQDDKNYYIGAYEDFPERVLIYKRYVVNKYTGVVSVESGY